MLFALKLITNIPSKFNSSRSYPEELVLRKTPQYSKKRPNTSIIFLALLRKKIPHLCPSFLAWPGCRITLLFPATHHRVIDVHFLGFRLETASNWIPKHQTLCGIARPGLAADNNHLRRFLQGKGTPQCFCICKAGGAVARRCALPKLEIVSSPGVLCAYKDIPRCCGLPG